MTSSTEPYQPVPQTSPAEPTPTRRFFFRIDKMRADPRHIRSENGIWGPPRPLGSNIRVAGDTTGILFYHEKDINGRSSIAVWQQALPQDLVPVKTVSMYYYGSIFHAVPFDAIANKVPGGREQDNESSEENGDGEVVNDWHTIGFNYPIFDPDPTYTSSVHIAGDHPKLWVRTLGQPWVGKLFPDSFIPDQAYPATPADFGGLVGDLGVFLGLLAFSTRPNRVQPVLQHCLTGNPWQSHNRIRREGWTDGRGVVVYIWTLRDEWTAFQELESGSMGKYFY